MTLAEFLERAASAIELDRRDALAPERLARRVTGVEYDSRRVTPGAVFVAMRGRVVDGASFAAEALDRGAVVVVAETAPPPGAEAGWLVTEDSRFALAALAATFFRHPSEELLVVGITGTNGKTTTSYLLQAIFEAAGQPTGRIGTTGFAFAGVERGLARTTPEAPDVQHLLRQMVDARCTAAVMEVSSHALALRRVDQMRFSAGIFTNLTRDHLDFHGSMEAYFAAKRRLFEQLPAAAPVIVNLDDAYGERLARDFPSATTYAIDRQADVRPDRITPSLDGLRFVVQSPLGPIDVTSPLVGRANAFNLLAAIAAAVALDLPRDAIARGAGALAAVPGRFERVSSPDDDVAVIVDYAHTDDALRSLLETARPLAHGRLVVVFGCGGDRDRTKRPLMGTVASRLADHVIVTSDNPRSEDPRAIIDDILAGLHAPPRAAATAGTGTPPGASRVATWEVLADRGEAIARAILDAEPHDLVVLAGKGHERTQEAGGRVSPFDDAAVARDALARRRTTAAVTPSGGAS